MGTLMALSNILIKNAKGGIKPDGTVTSKRYKISDGRGLYLEVAPNGGKWWRFKYRFNNKEKRMSVGVYPEISLAQARDWRDKYRLEISDGIDPLAQKQAEKIRIIEIETNSFETISREWFEKFSSTWTQAYSIRTITRMEQHIFPWIGKTNISKVTAPELLALIRRIENTGAIETAHRINQLCGQIFRYAIATARAERNPAADLKGAITPNKTKHHASITDPKKIGDLMRAINGYTGTFIAATALRLSPLVFLRPGELRKAEWSEIDFENKEWRIPAEKMKMRVTHITPLASQSIEILKEIEPLTGSGQFIFPSNRTVARPLSNNTINSALRRLGYANDEMTAHGFRSMASTLLNEQGWNTDAIERQLAHSEGNGVKAAYNYAQHMPERKKMMQHWADYLNELAAKI
jgi:integrase